MESHITIDDLYRMFHGKPLSDNLLGIRATASSRPAVAKWKQVRRNTPKTSNTTAQRPRRIQTSPNEMSKESAPLSEAMKEDTAEKQCDFETLPTEIKIIVLGHLNDLHELRMLVQASPVYHAAYLAARSEILTKVTLRTWPASLILEPASFAEVESTFRADREQVATTIKTVKKQWRDSGIVKLDVNQCITLLALRDYIPWKIIRASRSDNVEAVCDRFGIYERYRMGGIFQHIIFEDDCVYTEEELHEMWRDAVRADCQILAGRI